MMNTYVFEYLDENDFRKKERSVRKYNMLAYKKLTFSYYPELRKGTFLGKEVSRNEKDKTVSYELRLPTDELFMKVHGEIILHYTVYTEKGIILLTNITPEDILDEKPRSELSTYKGVMISKTNPEKDMFKINLINMLGGGSSSYGYRSNNYKSKGSNPKKEEEPLDYEKIKSKLIEVHNYRRNKAILEALYENEEIIKNNLFNDISNYYYKNVVCGEITKLFKKYNINNMDEVLKYACMPSNESVPNYIFYQLMDSLGFLAFVLGVWAFLLESTFLLIISIIGSPLLVISYFKKKGDNRFREYKEKRKIANYLLRPGVCEFVNNYKILSDCIEYLRNLWIERYKFYDSKILSLEKQIMTSLNMSVFDEKIVLKTVSKELDKKVNINEKKVPKDIVGIYLEEFNKMVKGKTWNYFVENYRAIDCQIRDEI